ncbi:sialidase family protein [Bailinhaonella thermotolerans]|uniref:Exo-alpha-sialidase n=1 Tax=Bailinhaonella thermotolerans TaxID=1070861 RepID=A0A3A4AZL4_9ACTN|nr:sialidase family protein [Bailinhaonella thermotolerans]RJL31283.1 exo-alpha-sialidase [Bailinhaonella thermotolerans]
MRARRLFGTFAAGVLLIGGLTVAAPTAGARSFGYQDLTPLQKRLASGVLTEPVPSAEAARSRRSALTGFAPGTAPGCDERRGSNVKVNQDCLNVADPDLAGRGQAQNEPWIAANPRDPNQVVAGYNDYRRGDSTCGASYSRDGGRTWADSTLPNGFVRGAAFGRPRQYYQAGGDPSTAWDSRGNVYFSCLAFKRGAATSPDADVSRGLYLFRSTGNGGASWNFPARVTAESDGTSGTNAHLLDKQLMAVDHHAGSPYRDRIYVTWTDFASDGTAYLYGAYSADHGETFSAPVLVSTDSPHCDNALGLPAPRGRCSVNQFSQPFVGGDGTLYVVFDNYNTAVTGADNRNRVLLVRSTDGGASFSAPVKVGDFYDLPDCLTYQGKNAGVACVPEKGPTANSFFRAANYPYGVVDPKNPRHVVVTYGSYIGRHSREASGCAPAGFSPVTGINLYDGVKTGGCNNDIVLSESADGGATFTGSATDVRELPVVSEEAGQRRTDQWWQGLDYSPTGRLAVAYYDRQYGDDATTGFSDLSMSVRRGAGFDTRRVTSSSMPPPTQFDPTAFYGDYIAVTATATHALPVWVDTRARALFPCPGGGPPRLCTASAPNARFANDQDIYTARVPLG